MKHNQFKHLINKWVKDECKQLDLQFSGVDITNNSKMIYIYDSNWNCKLTINLWVNDKEVHIVASTKTDTPAGILNKEFECNCSYTKFGLIIQTLQKVFNSIE